MKHMKKITILITVSALYYLAAGSELPADPNKKFAYALGVNLGFNLKRLDKILSEDELKFMLQGYIDMLKGTALIDEVTAKEIISEFQRIAFNELAEKNLNISKKFLEENKMRPGVHVSSSGLQYEIIKEGNGEPPSTNDIVIVNYKGMLIDGTVFDSSEKRGSADKFVVSRVIPGWKEALLMMKPGAKWKIYVPPELAYGRSGGFGRIGPNQVLIFELELLGIEKQPLQETSTTQHQPVVTSQIVRIPSKEELEKGAKPEIINPEQLKELEKSQTNVRK